jgi:hypothetical protein
MKRLHQWLSLERLTLVLYLLLWPPFFVLLSRQSESPTVLGRWTPRMFVLLVGMAGFLAGATYLLFRRGASSRAANCEEHLTSPSTPTTADQGPSSRRLATLRVDGLAAFVRRTRTDRRIAWLAHGIPLTLLLAGIVYCGILGVVVTPALAICAANAVLLIVVWEMILIFPLRAASEQRELVKKLLFTCFTLLLALLLVEGLAASFQVGRFLDWHINPPHLDVRHRSAEFDVRVVTNDQGLREQATIEPSSNVYRIVVVGDSMTFGWGVDASECFAKVMETRLTVSLPHERIEVINMGRPGTSPIDYLHFVREYAVRLNPDLIVVGFLIGNDCPLIPPPQQRDEATIQEVVARHTSTTPLSSVTRGLNRLFLIRLVAAGGYRNLARLRMLQDDSRRGALFGEINPLEPQVLEADIAHRPDRDSIERRYEALSEIGLIERGRQWDINPWLIHSAMMHPEGVADALGLRAEILPAMQSEWTVCEGVLAAMSKSAERASSELLVLAIPCAYQVSPESVDFLAEMNCVAMPEMLTSRVVNDWLVQFCRNENVECVDPLSDLREAQRAGEGVYFAQDGHLNAAGHRIVGNVLAEWLTSSL